MVESEGKHKQHLLDLDDIICEPTDPMPTFEEILALVDGVKEKITKNDNCDINLLLQTEQLYKNVKDIKDAINSDSSSKSDENLCKELLSKQANDEKLSVVMAEYEKQIAKLVRDNAHFVKERDTFEIHLTNLEAAFSEVHQKYERCKAVIEDFKHNEDVLKETIKANEEAILKLCNKFETLKRHTMEQLDKANNEVAETNAKYEDEVLRLTATIKRLELKIASLKAAVDQRNKENEELSRIFDDIVGKVGP
ncbi:transforming acidic coiled-coil-containing protein 3-like [Chrysoperla carnea]|uniref:transforming acidic coiled-coil-containing protein 3-like n=1 Tax=Chrysoperla carnea TaxID=189513 RepID=UPI001D082734|nr:transforming acidic coiled-coil-containing protein 3-like [Chrysoperla carnea]